MFMQNKIITSPKSLRSYLDILHSNSKKRKSIFSHSRAPSADKSAHKSINQSTTIDRSRTHLKTENVEERNTEDLVGQMTQLLSIIKVKYNVYIEAESQNLHLKRQNNFLKQQLARLRQIIGQNSQPRNNIQAFKARNSVLQERFIRARKQLKELKRLYANTGDITQDIERVCDILHDDSING